ncbi:MAG: 1-deoxy-D-xylulose-5-phosphate synthase N-terminal domain-containing protein, partial [Methylococcales bacterium]|nr:1-deoxy-D-xylulose-5-phosphate synthase N-terminal domain-containing protein [Methylococcales bacterium]
MNTLPNYPLLNRINSPADVRKLRKDQLKPLAQELREYLTHTVSISGGHFSAGLGTVELTIALHYVFDTPSDQLVWDVGHQAYPHKILTGRKERMTTIRTLHGVSAF